MSGAAARAIAQSRLGFAALVIAAVAVVAFIAFMSISGPFPKSLVYGHNVLYEGYEQLPFISNVAAVLAVLVGIAALWRAASALLPAIAGAVVGVALFNAVMVFAASLVLTVAPAQDAGKGVTMPASPSLTLSPPAIAMTALLIGVALVLVRIKGTHASRAAMAALVMGGAVAFYWLFNLVWSLNAE